MGFGLTGRGMLRRQLVVLVDRESRDTLPALLTARYFNVKIPLVSHLTVRASAHDATPSSPADCQESPPRAF